MTNDEQPRSHEVDSKAIVAAVLSGVEDLLRRYGLVIRATVPYPSVHAPKTNALITGSTIQYTVGTSMTSDYHFVNLYHEASSKLHESRKIVTADWVNNEFTSEFKNVPVPPPAGMPFEYALECIGPNANSNRHRILVRVRS